jgi:hypothetical protein
MSTWTMQNVFYNVNKPLILLAVFRASLFPIGPVVAIPDDTLPN